MNRFVPAALVSVAVWVAACARPQAQPQPVPPLTARAVANPADVEFMTGMIHHHAQAILISKWAPTHNASEALQRLAERIAVAQRDEINLITAWLRDHGLEPHEHEMLMPGMLSAAQLDSLDASRGKDFDKLFLRYMIQHHRGAITMVEKLHGSYGGAQDETVFRFSSDVVADQTTEIDRMQTMIDALERLR